MCQPGIGLYFEAACVRQPAGCHASPQPQPRASRSVAVVGGVDEPYPPWAVFERRLDAVVVAHNGYSGVSTSGGGGWSRPAHGRRECGRAGGAVRLLTGRADPGCAVRCADVLTG